jgi:hypothetical protein
VQTRRKSAVSGIVFNLSGEETPLLFRDIDSLLIELGFAGRRTGTMFILDDSEIASGVPGQQACQRKQAWMTGRL